MAGPSDHHGRNTQLLLGDPTRIVGCDNKNIDWPANSLFARLKPHRVNRGAHRVAREVDCVLQGKELKWHAKVRDGRRSCPTCSHQRDIVYQALKNIDLSTPVRPRLSSCVEFLHSSVRQSGEDNLLS